MAHRHADSWNIISPFDGSTPILSVTDPAKVISAQPSFFVCECLFLLLSVWGIVDACCRRKGILIFLACLVGGTAVELATILHPQIGNFYHSQATIMLLDGREPLYMLLGCYGWIAYAAVVLAGKLGSGPLSEAALAALLGSEAWALLDGIGAQFLWWTWHDSEPLYEDREMGVPIASSFWIMASMGSLALIVRYCPCNPLWGFIAGPFATLGLMHIPFLVIYHPLVTAAGFHASYAMWLFRAICSFPLLLQLGTPRPAKGLFAQMLVYVVPLVYVALAMDPTHEKRSSYGQPCAPICEDLEGSFWGAFTRKRYVCTGSIVQDLFRLCDEQCGQGPHEFYTTCGIEPGQDFKIRVVVHAAILLTLALLPFQRREKAKSQ